MSDSTFTTREDTGWQRDSFSVLWRFLKSLKLLHYILAPYSIFFFLAIATPQFFSWLMSEYGRCQEDKLELCQSANIFGWPGVSVTLNLLIIVMLIGIISRPIAWMLFEITGMWSARGIHARMMDALSKTRTTYFDENPSGRLINRMVRDFDNLRMTGVIRVGDTVFAFGDIIAHASLAIAASPWAGLLVLPTIGASLYIQRYVSPMLQRCGTLRSVRLGELLHRETDVIEGGRVFQLFSLDHSLSKRLRQAVRGFVQINILRVNIESWGRFWLNFMASTYSFFVLLFVAYSVNQGSLSKTWAAVIITAVFKLNDSLGWFNWIVTYLIESIAGARRVFEIVDLPNEESQEGTPQPQASLSGKPQAGDISYVNYSMSYRKDLPLVLDKVNLHIPYGKRVGIIGRTGSGKTSLIQSLYRMVYVQGGDIKIGDKSIFGAAIEDVRTLFGMVPQDPYLFAGDLRTNIDRLGELDDDTLNTALANVGLELPLKHEVIEGGRNLSLGERQLLCLARVLVTKRPFVLMDEPTSSVDTITDAKIQHVLRELLKDKSVITIAHRLETLSQYDWIIEMNQGKVVSCGPNLVVGV